MDNLIIIGVVALVLTLAVIYIVKAKKSGKRCIGCPMNGQCGSCNGKHNEIQ